MFSFASNQHIFRTRLSFFSAGYNLVWSAQRESLARLFRLSACCRHRQVVSRQLIIETHSSRKFQGDLSLQGNCLAATLKTKRGGGKIIFLSKLTNLEARFGLFQKHFGHTAFELNCQAQKHYEGFANILKVS